MYTSGSGNRAVLLDLVWNLLYGINLAIMVVLT